MPRQKKTKFLFMKKKTKRMPHPGKRQPKLGHVERGETTQAPYAIGADMSQSGNY